MCKYNFHHLIIKDTKMSICLIVKLYSLSSPYYILLPRQNQKPKQPEKVIVQYVSFQFLQISAFPDIKVDHNCSIAQV